MNTPIIGKADTKQIVKKTQQELGKLKDLLEEDLRRLRPAQDNAKNKGLSREGLTKWLVVVIIHRVSLPVTDSLIVNITESIEFLTGSSS